MRDSYERPGALYSSGVDSSSSLVGVRVRALSSRMLGALSSRMLGALYARVEPTPSLYPNMLGALSSHMLGALYSSGVESSSSLLAVRPRPLPSSLLGALSSRMLGALYARVEPTPVSGWRTPTSSLLSHARCPLISRATSSLL